MVIKTASPGVYIQEVDLTRGAPDEISNNNGFLAGPFQMGPVDEVVKVTTESDLATNFGKPQVEESQYEYWYSVDNFLEYGGQCYVVRCDDSNGDYQIMKNACDNFFYDPSLEGQQNPGTGLTYKPNELFNSNVYIKNTAEFESLITQSPTGIGLAFAPNSVSVESQGQNYRSGVCAVEGGSGTGMTVRIIADNVGAITNAILINPGTITAPNGKKVIGYNDGEIVTVVQEDGLGGDTPANGKLKISVPNARFVSKNPGSWGNGLGVAVIDSGADYQLKLSSSSAKNMKTLESDEGGTFSDVGIKPGKQVGEYVRIRVDPANSKEFFPEVRLAQSSSDANFEDIDLEGELEIDGVQTRANDRVLIWKMENQALNGIYRVKTGRWTRPVGANYGENFVPGKSIFVNEGETNAGALFEYDGVEDPALDYDVSKGYFDDVDLATVEGENIDLTDRMRTGRPTAFGKVRLQLPVVNGRLRAANGTALNILRNNDKYDWRFPSVKVATTSPTYGDVYGDSTGDPYGTGNVVIEDAYGNRAAAVGVVIDGYKVKLNDFVLLKDQDNEAENGIYIATNSGWTRVGKARYDSDFVTNKLVYVEKGIGETNENTWWQYTGSFADNKDTLTDTPRTFEEFVSPSELGLNSGPNRIAATDLVENDRVLILGLEESWYPDAGIDPDGNGGITDPDAITASDNGIYIVTKNGPWTRAVDADAGNEFRQHKIVEVTDSDSGPDYYEFWSQALADAGRPSLNYVGGMSAAKTFRRLTLEVGQSGVQALGTETGNDVPADLSGETIDSLTTNETRVLLKNQTDLTENGIYITSEGPWSRASDVDNNSDFVDLKRVRVKNSKGNSGPQEGATFLLRVPSPFSLGTSNIRFVDFAADDLPFSRNFDIAKPGDIIQGPERLVEGTKRRARAVVMEINVAGSAESEVPAGAGRVMLIPDVPGKTPINFRTDDPIILNSDGADVYVGDAIEVYAEGAHIYYNKSYTNDLMINTIFVKNGFSRNEGIGWGYPARPFEGQKVSKDTLRLDAVGVPETDENGNALFVGGPAALGMPLTWNSLTESWEVNYITDTVNDLIHDETNFFNINASDDWYSKQIAFEGIPWTNFGPRPGTSYDAQNKGAFKDELNIIVYDATGEFMQAIDLPGGKGTVLDSYIQVSKLRGAKTVEGSENFYQDLINSRNPYLFSNAQLYTLDINIANIEMAEPGTPMGSGVICKYLQPRYGSIDNVDINKRVDVPYLLKGGVNNLSATQGEIESGYQRVITDNLSDLDYIIQGPSDPSGRISDSQNDYAPAVAKSNLMISLAEELKTCMAFITPPRSAAIEPIDAAEITREVIKWADQLASSSYAVIDSGYKYGYDRFNDRYSYFPLCADVAGCIARMSLLTQPYYSPAGMSRGQVKNVVKLSYNPNKSQRDDLYSARVNPVATFPGEGTVLYGDKTALAYASAFSRINVRRLFIYIERQVQQSARQVLFEFNDTPTRINFKNNVSPILRDIQSLRGLTDFLIVCDESNNTPEVIDRNEFIADFYIKPNKSINFVQLTFVATKSGVSFGEAVGNFRRP